MAYQADAPRKPFITRGSRVIRCEACLLPAQRCLCTDKPDVAAKAVFWLLTHHDEFYKPSNTGRLIVDAIHGSKTFEWSRTEPDPDFIALLSDARYRPYLVFPQEADYQQRMVDVESVQRPDERIPAFIILDGTWRQARRMFRLSRYLDALPVFEPTVTGLSRYQLRQSAQPHHLCTAEVGAAVLRDIQDEQSASVLDAYFDLFNAEYFASRRSADTKGAALAAREQLQYLMASKLD